jgi:hypothetical protein
MKLGGDKMRLVEAEDGSAVVHFDNVGIGRACGDCQLCCRLLGVKSMHKPAGQKCQHQRFGKGCAIYADRPRDCRTWSCRWLCDESTRGLRRPDHGHYVVDLTYDTVTQQGQTVSALQIWIDPKYPDAHRAPELRKWLAEMGEKYRVAAIVRYGTNNAFVLAPPALTGTGEFAELRSCEFVQKSLVPTAVRLTGIQFASES